MAMRSPISPKIEILGSSTRRVSGLDSKTFQTLLASEKEALGRRAEETVLTPSPNSKKSKRRRNFTNLRGQISMVADSFRKMNGRSEGADHIKFDLEKSKQETVGIFFRQGDGYDRDSGIFVSRLEMGCTAEIMGLHVGDEVVEVNGVDVAMGDIEWVEMLMKVVNVVVLKVRKRTHGVSDYMRHMPPSESLVSPIALPSPRPEVPDRGFADGPAGGYHQPRSAQSDEERTAFMLAPEGNSYDSRLYEASSPDELFIEETSEIGSQPPWMAGMRGAPWPPALSADSPPPSTEVHHSGGGQVRRLPDAADAGLHRSLSPDPVVVARTRANTRANRNSFHLVDPTDLHTVPTPNRTTEQRRRSVQFILPSPETELAVDESQLRGWTRTGVSFDAPTESGGGLEEPPGMRDYPYNSLEHHDMMSSQLDRLLAKARNLKGSPASESVDQLLANAVAAAANSAYASTTRAVGATPLVPVVVPRKLEYLARANGRTATYGPTKVISIDRGDSQYGLGITIAGGADTELGALFVAHVFPGSIADLDGRIWEGDRILSLNYVDTFDLTQLELVGLLESIKGGEVVMGLMRIGSDQWEVLRQQAGIWDLPVGGISEPAAAVAAGAATVEAPPVLALPPEAVAALAALTEVNGVFSRPTAAATLPPLPRETPTPPPPPPPQAAIGPLLAFPTSTPKVPLVPRSSLLQGPRSLSLPTLESYRSPSPVLAPTPAPKPIPAVVMSRESLGLRLDARAPVKQSKAAGAMLREDPGKRPLEDRPAPASSVAPHPSQSPSDQPWELTAAVSSADSRDAGARAAAETDQEETGPPPLPPPPIDFLEDGEETADEDATGPPGGPSLAAPTDAETDAVSAATAARETATATVAVDVAAARATVLKANAESARLRLRSFLPAQRDTARTEEDIDLGDLSDLDLGSDESEEDDELIQELVAADNLRKASDAVLRNANASQLDRGGGASQRQPAEHAAISAASSNLRAQLLGIADSPRRRRLPPRPD